MSSRFVDFPATITAHSAVVLHGKAMRSPKKRKQVYMKSMFLGYFAPALFSWFEYIEEDPRAKPVRCLDFPSARGIVSLEKFMQKILHRKM